MLIKTASIGIILLFLLSTVSPMVLGFNAEKVDMSKQSADGPMDSPWPMKCHDTKHTGRSPYSTADNLGIEKWRFITDNWIEGGIILDNDGIIYFGDFGRHLNAVYPNGSLKWKTMLDDRIWSTPAIDEDGTIYIGTFWEYFYAINSENGNIEWEIVLDGAISSSPAIANDGTIYFGTNNNYIYAINPNSVIKWSYKTGGFITSDPAIGEEGTIYIGSADGYLYAMNPNGTLKWRFETGDWVKSHPSIAEDGTIYFGSFDGYLYALNPDGSLKWTFDNPGSGVVAAVIAEDGTIYLGGNKLYAINPNDGSEKWIFNLGSDRHISFSTPAISNDGVIFVGVDIDGPNGGELIAVNPDGTERWRSGKICANWIYSSPCIDSDGTIYIGSSSFLDVESGGVKPFGYLHAFGSIDSNDPPNKPTITGTLNGNIEEEYGYTISTIDPDNNPVSFYIDWGDGNEGWEMSRASGEECFYKHTWSEQGDYTIRVKAKDSSGAESDWATLEVTMPRNIANSISKYTEDNITIDIRGGLGITIEIKNNGDSSISLVNWSFILDCPLLFFGSTSEGSISEISPGVSETIKAGVLGFGSITITVQINDMIESRKGFLLGPFVFILDGGIH